MSYIQEYPLLPPLSKIERHDQLPEGSVVIGQIRGGHQNDDPLYLFIKRGHFLSIIITYEDHWGGKDHYNCEQYDFPLKILSWFPKALADFQRPPSEGGLHAGAMISKDQDVDGEMLAVGSTTQGYNITNWSRDADGVDADPNYYEPTTLDLSYELLSDFGLLRVWKELGNKYDAGEL